MAYIKNKNVKKEEDIKQNEVKEVSEVKENNEESKKEDTKENTLNEVKSEPVKKEKQKRQIDKSDSVTVRSVVNNDLIYVSRRSHITIEWAEYGDEQYVEVGELMTMKSSQPKFLTEPWLIIEDEDVVEFLGLKSVYDKLIPIENIEKFLLNTKPEVIEEQLKMAPRGMKDLVVDKAREMVENDKLYDIRIMRILDKVLNIELSMIQK